MARRRLLADLALLGVAFIWGATFVAIKRALDSVPTFAFLAVRFTLAALVLGVAWAAVGARKGPERARRVLLPGIVTGLALFLGYAFQTTGLLYTGASQAGLITGLYVPLTAVFAAALLRRRPGPAAVAGVVSATAGLALLSGPSTLSLGRGELLVTLCAVAFALHIIAVGRFAPDLPPLTLAAAQVGWVAAFTWAGSLALDGSFWRALAGGPGGLGGGLARLPGQVWGAVFLTGVLATAAAFFIQTAAQRFTSPTHTALIYASEPVWAAVFGMALLGERLTPRGWVGAALVLLGMILPEIPGRATAAPSGRPAPAERAVDRRAP